MDDGCAPPTPEDELEIARRAMAEGDLVHSAHHLAGALAADPERPEFLAFLDRLLLAADDPLRLALIPDDRPAFFGTVALRAEILARRGELEQAINLASQVVRVKPTAPYLVWARRWLDARGAAQLSADVLASIAGHLIGALIVSPSGLPAGDPRRRNVEEALRMLDTIRELAPKQGLPLAATALAMRRLGRFEDAVGFAERAHEVEPNYFMAVAVASARREVGDMAGAARAFELALTHQRAQPSLLYVRHLRGDEDAAAELTTLAATQLENEHAQSLAASLDIFRRSLPVPVDAGAKVLSQLAAKGVKSGRIDMALSGLESPSVRTAFRLAGEKLGTPWELAVAVQEVQRPDPRVSRRPSRFVPWRYEGTDPVPCFDPPPADVLDRIAEVASTPYDLARWAEDARVIGRAIGPERAGELVGAMLHPPPTPEAAAAAFWVYAVQVVAALALLGVDGGWKGSVRREALVGLALGPMDWTVDAAVIALARLGEHDQAARAEAHEIFRELLGATPRPGHVSYELPIVCAWAWLPDLPAAEKQALLRRRRTIEAGGDEDADPAPAPKPAKKKRPRGAGPSAGTSMQRATGAAPAESRPLPIALIVVGAILVALVALARRGC